MPAAKDVKPGRWINVQVLYDDGEYSCIWGDYDDSFDHPIRPSVRGHLGVRWNEAPHGTGYPSARGYPQWYVEPHFLVRPVLTGLREKLLSQPASPERDEYLRRIGNHLLRLG